MKYTPRKISAFFISKLVIDSTTLPFRYPVNISVIPDINITMLARMILFKSSLTSFIRGMNSFKFFFIFIPP